MARKSKSLEQLLKQIDLQAPKRKKASDGWIGDKAHQKVVSDHNPNPLGVVLALDVTHDPKNGADMQKIADSIFDSKDNRIWYIIFNKRIRYMGGKWQPYYGSNPHTKHAHFNNVHTRSRYDNSQVWNIKGKEDMFKGKSAETHYKEAKVWKSKTLNLRKLYASAQATIKKLEKSKAQVNEFNAIGKALVDLIAKFGYKKSK